MSGIAPNGLKLFQIGEKEKVLRVVSSTLGEKKDTTSETKAINCNNDFRHCIREQEREIDQEGVSRAVRTFVMWRTNNPSLLLVSSSLLRVCVYVTLLWWSIGHSLWGRRRDRMSTSHQRLATGGSQRCSCRPTPLIIVFYCRTSTSSLF